MHSFFQALVRDNRGTTAIETGIIVGAVAVATIAVIGAIGGQLVKRLGNVAAAFQ